MRFEGTYVAMVTPFTKDEETKLSALMIDASDSSISDNELSDFTKLYFS